MHKHGFITAVLIAVVLIGVISFFFADKKSTESKVQKQTSILPTPIPQISLSISAERKKSYPGSDMVIEQTLPDGENYHQYIASYVSDGLKIYGLLTVPTSSMPSGGYSAIIFNHGYIAPQTYQTDPSVGQYASYLPPFAEDGYVVFKPDYRGNGNSEGKPQGAYYSDSYGTDVLNALASVKKLKVSLLPLSPQPSLKERGSSLVNSQKIGMWGHSMGGNLTMRALIVDPKDIKAAVIWSGVVGTYTQLEHWHDPSFHPPPEDLALRNQYRQQLFKQYGTPETNPAFWNSIDPRSFVSDITAPIQIQQSLQDEEVPPTMAQSFVADLKKAGKNVTYYEYPTGDHNLSQDFDAAMQRSLEFFDKYLK